MATHEAGHALVAELSGRRVTVASILRRSDALGLVAHEDERERHLSTPSEGRALMRVALGGLVAEELELGEASSGVVADLAAATGLAAQLVGAMGAGGSRLSLEAAAVLGARNLVAKVLGDEAARAAAEELVAEAEAATRELVGAHRDALAALATALVDQDELTGDEVRLVLVEHGAIPAGRLSMAGSSAGAGRAGGNQAGLLSTSRSSRSSVFCIAGGWRLGKPIIETSQGALAVDQSNSSVTLVPPSVGSSR